MTVIDEVKVLVIDDEQTYLDLITETLKEKNYKILQALNGKMGCMVAQKFIPDIIITDWEMPELNGIETIKALKKNPAIQDIPVIMCTGIMTSSQNLDAALNAGAVDFIRKPIEALELIARINSALNLSESIKKVKLQNEDIIRNQEELRAQKEELQSTLEHLKLTQAELIQSEKMASLGQLIAGIAHEINTPLGAINASINTIVDSTQQSIKLLPELVKVLSDNELDLFMLLINSSLENNNLKTSKEERDFRKKLSVELQEKGIADADDMADTLVDMGIYSDIEPFLTLLKPLSLQAAYHISMQVKNSKNIKMAVDKASKIVFALKNYARYANENKMVPANILDGLDTVLTLYQNHFKHGITLHKEFEEIPQILCYPDELNQVWTNIIHNAIQSMEGKGELSISVKKTLTAFQTPSGLEINITDTGKGIPTEFKDRIFDAFFTTKASGEGSGLGLHIVKQIIDKHKGSITFTSEPGKGTSFTVLFPINDIDSYV